MHKPPFAVDPRYFQVIFQAVFLCYGIVYLQWNAGYLHYMISIAGCLLFQYTADSFIAKRFLKFGEFNRWGFSVLISAMSLCLLLKTNNWYISLFAAFLTVAGKYIFRIRGRHIFNPSALGIAAAILLTNDAWLSPGQWGSNAVIFFAVCSLGFIVVTKVQKLDISLAFLFTYTGLLFARQVLYLHWPADFFIQSVSTGSLLLFSFFMISDPRTSPDHPMARIIWAMLIAAVAFYLSAFKWMYNTPIWVLVAAAPLVPLLDRIFKQKRFEWNPVSFRINPFIKLKPVFMKSFMKKTAAAILLTVLLGHDVLAFCGFYVSKADGTLKNKTSQVIVVRDGNKTVITMYNDYKGELKDFAMVVPVPVVLGKQDIHVIDQSLFDRLNDYSKPRLVEYYDQNPCNKYLYDKSESMRPSALNEVVVSGYGISKKKDLGVKIEAKYIVGEYDILILSAKESSGLKEWLTGNGYKIPEQAEEVLGPYIKSNLKFFVVKVNPAEKKKLPGNFLRPLQIKFNSPKFMLPIRLGMANADGDQDMIVYAFTRQGRIECTNYRTVNMPTGKNIPLFVQNNFGGFYANAFNHQWKKEGKSIALLEYAWDVSPQNFMKCDPCVGNPPAMQDLVQSGVWWLQGNEDDEEEYVNYGPSDRKVYFTRLHVRYNRNSFPQDMVFQVTPNKENFQARYIITHPATGDFNCEAGRRYLEELKKRRQSEMNMLTALTGKNYNDWDVVMNDEEKLIPAEASYAGIAPVDNNPGNKFFLIAVLALAGIAYLSRFRKTGSAK
jgi:Na+-translocating ferredoxin:NAD+ oxidoreductase RnfD subunit